MSKRDSTHEEPALQVVGFHVDKPAETLSIEGEAEGAAGSVGEASLPYLPPSKVVRSPFHLNYRLCSCGLLVRGMACESHGALACHPAAGG